MMQSLANAVWIIGAFFRPGRKRGSETVHGHMPITQAIENGEHRHV
jgi:hypothetical protein